MIGISVVFMEDGNDKLLILRNTLFDVKEMKGIAIICEFSVVHGEVEVMHAKYFNVLQHTNIELYNSTAVKTMAKMYHPFLYIYMSP